MKSVGSVSLMSMCTGDNSSDDASQGWVGQDCLPSVSFRRAARDGHAEPELPRLPRLLAASDRATLLMSPPFPPGSSERRASGAFACSKHSEMKHSKEQTNRKHQYPPCTL